MIGGGSRPYPYVDSDYYPGRRRLRQRASAPEARDSGVVGSGGEAEGPDAQTRRGSTGPSVEVGAEWDERMLAEGALGAGAARAALLAEVDEPDAYFESHGRDSHRNDDRRRGFHRDEPPSQARRAPGRTHGDMGGGMVHARRSHAGGGRRLLFGGLNAGVGGNGAGGGAATGGGLPAFNFPPPPAPLPPSPTVYCTCQPIEYDLKTAPPPPPTPPPNQPPPWWG